MTDRPTNQLRRGMDRRRFLKVSALSGVGFMIGCSENEPGSSTQSSIAENSGLAVDSSDLNAFVRISSDNSVTVIVKHLDKGQGVTTGLPAIVAEEMDADWSQMRAEFAPADAGRYNNLMFGPVQATAGSTSIANSWMQLREAAAGARDMLVRAATDRWDVPVDEIEISAGVVSGGGHTATFGELATSAGQLLPPDEVSLKDPSQFTLIGTDLPRLDSSAKTDGSAKFTIDLVRPNMLIAVVAHPPRFGAQVASFDATKATSIAGVKQVVQIPRGIAVLADSYFSALKGRKALQIEWDDSNAETRSSDEMYQEFSRLLDESGKTTYNSGEVVGALKSAEKIIEADFSFPFLSHAPMEPMDCIVELSADSCHIWTGSQTQTGDQAVAANIVGLDPANVHINTVFAGGSFGRRAAPGSDYVAEAAMIAKAIDGAAAVKLQWSREDDMSGGQYRPVSAHRIRAGISEDGNLIAWDQRIVSHSIFTGTPFEALMQDGIDPSSIEGSQDLPYAIANRHLDLHTVENKVPVSFWRSVGHSQNAFATEVFFDQVALAMARDPYELRRELLRGQPRYIGVLDKAAGESGWGESLGQNRGRGIAVHKTYGTFVAQVAEVTIGAKGELRVDRVVCAVDCGIAITPDVIRAQMEGGIGYGLSAALREAVTLTEGIVDQKNFDTYRPLRMNEMPRIEVHIISSNEAPTGVGEPGTPPIAPAVANAIADATGRHLTRLPIADQLVGI